MAKYTKDELLHIWINSFSDIDYRQKTVYLEVLEDSESIKESLIKSQDYLISETGEEKFNEVLRCAEVEYLKSQIALLETNGLTAITLKSENYPQRLKDTEEPPVCLYAKGNIDLLNDKEIVGIVGSRKSLPTCINQVKEYAEGLAKNGITIVSGIAEGVDVSAITSALDHGGKVISVIASGIDCLYPSAHKGVIDRVAKNGLVISEYPPKVNAKPFFFPFRNRIIAGLSDAVLIASGNAKSGVLYTAKYATQYGRKIFAYPYARGVDSGVACNNLIKVGEATLTDGVDDISSYFGKEIKIEKIELDDLERGIVRAITDGKTHVEMIAKAVSKKPFEITPALSMLEIKGVIVKNGVNVYACLRTDLEE